MYSCTPFFSFIIEYKPNENMYFYIEIHIFYGSTAYGCYRTTVNNSNISYNWFYKLFVKKKNITSFYTPFDHMTGQTISEFHEEQKVLVAEGEDGDGKKKK
ncbi:hypothetical protein B4117_1789 [Bacillus mycoides]|nr:hypothetical protein B4117_1789 [Bacillus mycoides]